MAPSDAFASFETKWTTAHPEFGLALRFVDAAQRTPRSALACIGYEIEHATFRIAETQVATGKLQWWLEEFVELGAGRARHPLTQALAASAVVAQVPMQAWHALIAGALAQRESEPASTLEHVLDGYRALYRPLDQVAGMLVADAGGEATVSARALSRAFRETIALPEVLARGQLVLPLDLLARHRLSRTDLANATRERAGALRDYLGSLAARMQALDVDALPTLDAVAVHADSWRCRRAAVARDPLAAGAESFARLPFSTPWAAWRSARRHARR